jgi:hypothetical protein
METERDFDVVGFCLAWEMGEIESEEELAEGFQYLIDSGIVWQLQGSYGRTAKRLIEAGICRP